jgi:hypothetical protein
MHFMHNSKYNNDLVIIDLLINDFNRYFNYLNFALIIYIFINTLLLILGFKDY